MSAAAEYLGYVGWKTYTTTGAKAQFHVGLSEIATGKLVVLIQADYLGQLRTGAASGVAISTWLRRMPRPSASSARETGPHPTEGGDHGPPHRAG